MPGKRAPGQKMITFWADGELLTTLDSARKRPPKLDRSQFIRNALIDKLRDLGYPVDEALAQAPDRASKEMIPSKVIQMRPAAKAASYAKRKKKAGV
jgi:hypothetical protein